MLPDSESVTPEATNDTPPEFIPADPDKITDPYRKLCGTKPAPNGLGSGGIQDIKTFAQAIRNRFPISEKTRADAAAWLADVAENARDARARVNAVRALVEMDKLNMEQESRDQGGQVQRIDVTSGGKPLVSDVSKLSPEELEQRIRALEGG